MTQLMGGATRYDMPCPEVLDNIIIYASELDVYRGKCTNYWDVLAALEWRMVLRQISAMPHGILIISRMPHNFIYNIYYATVLYT
jgi:hypothetical protein